MTGGLRKVTPRRTHWERAQPKARTKLGLLEKHKDYVLRAKAFHRKEKRIKALWEKARDRNPDEFYFGMVNAKTKDGVHVAERDQGFSEDYLKLLKTQDKNYVTNQMNLNAKKIEKLKASLHFLEPAAKAPENDDEDEDDDAAQAAKPKPRSRQHTVFVDSAEEAKNFDAATHFDTVPELVGRTFNRPTRAMLEKLTMPDLKRDVPSKALKQAERERAAKYAELASRIVRDNQLRETSREMDIRRALTQKGRHRKVGVDERGLPVHKWKPDRQK